jgi:putative restriction endonuclease
MKSALPERHLQALNWFADHRDKDIGWPAPLRDGTLLVTRAKGIYKPRWTTYALSVRHAIHGPYPDRDLTMGREGSWSYRYFQENLDVTSLKSEFTNRGMLACVADQVPVGVLVQIQSRPNSRYRVMGLADVTGWHDGYFELRGRLSF